MVELAVLLRVCSCGRLASKPMADAVERAHVSKAGNGLVSMAYSRCKTYRL